MTSNTTTFDSAEAARFYNVYRRGRCSRMERRMFRRFVRPGCRVLDLGCGTGRTTGPLHALGADVVGVDIAPAMVAEARRQHPGVTFECGDAARLRFDDGAFDVVFFLANGLDCVHPVDERRAAVREVARVLAPGGVFVFTSRNALCLLPWPRHLAEVVRNTLNGAVFRGPYRTIPTPHGPLQIHFSHPLRERQRIAPEFATVELHTTVPRRLPVLGDLPMLLLEPFPYFVAHKAPR